jgi:hypothetical protein
MAFRARVGWSSVTVGVVVAVCACGGSVFGDGTTAAGGANGIGGSKETGGSVGTGGTGEGGSSAKGGAAGLADAGHDAAGPCSAGDVTFRMMAPAGNEAAFCTGISCGASFLIVTDPNGHTLDVGGGCVTTCDVCQPIACAGGGACAAPRPMTAQGEELAWDGSYFVSSTCGSGFACTDHQCAAPGTYKATMCASPNLAPDASTSFYCAAGQMAVCTTVSFDYPGTSLVTGWLAGIK